MGDTLAKLKVVLEASTAQYKKEMNQVKQVTKGVSDSIQAETSKVRQATRMDNVTESVKKQTSVLQKMKRSLTAFQLKTGIKAPTEEYTKAVEDIRKYRQAISDTEKILDRYYEKRDKMEYLGVDKESQSWRSLAYDIRNAEAQMERYKASKAAAVSRKSEMVSEGTAFKRPYSVPKEIGKGILSIPKLGFTALTKGYGGLFKVVNTAASAFLKFNTVIRRTSGAFASLIQKFTSGIPVIRRFTSAQKSSNGGIGSGIKTLLKYTLGIRSLFVLANKLRSALVSGFNNLSQYSGETNNSLSMLMSSLTQLKNAFAAAFAPLLNIVAPILNSFIQKVISAVNAMGQLISALTGSGTYIKAKKLNQDYAKSLNGNASSANKAQKANEKLQRTILGFDQINKMDDNSSADTSSGSDADTGLTGKDMFETGNITGNIKGFADKIKAAWKKADFTEIGAIVGRKLNAALRSIPWDSIKETCNRIAKSIATFLNGFLETVDWGLVGNTISQGINTAFGMVNTFAQNFHWGSLGTAIGNGINGALGGIDWNLIQSTAHNVGSGVVTSLNNAISTTNWGLVGQSIGRFFNAKLEFLYTVIHNFSWNGVGQAIASSLNGIFETFDFAKTGKSVSDFVRGVLNTCITAIENTNWALIGERIAQFLDNIDWVGIAGDLFAVLSAAIGAALGALSGFIGQLVVDGINGAKQYFADAIDDCGGNIALGILKGIVDVFVNIGKWIYENIFEPFINTFKSCFGIHSPSTVMAEQGGYVMLGFLEGLKDKIGSVLDWIGELPGKIKDKLGDAKKWIKDKGSDAVQGMRSGWEAVKDSKFLRTVGKIKDEAFKKIGNIKEKMTTKGKDIVSGMKQGLSGRWSSLTDYLGNIPGRISKAIPDLSTIGHNAMQTLANGFGSVHIPLPHITVSWNPHSVGPLNFSTPSFGLQWYAKGGFPQIGEMFVARENGPEMVGRMGRRNAVANNNQIVEGIKAGVFEAVLDAFQASGAFGDKGKDKDVTVELTIKADSETLYKAVRKGQKKYDDRYHVIVTT